MSIIKELELNVSGEEAKLNEKIYVYQNDRGIELKLKINNDLSEKKYKLLLDKFENSLKLPAKVV